VKVIIRTLIAAAVALHAAPVLAQPSERVFISFNGAAQVTKNPFTDRSEFDVGPEQGTTEADYPVEGGLLIDGSIAVRLWKDLAAGVAISHFTRDEVVATVSRIPHPFFFEMLREVTGDASATRTERAVHVQAIYRFRAGGPITVALFGGPSFMRVEQDFVTSVQYNEEYPFDTATFRQAVTESVSGSAVGFNAGADVAWMFTRHIGVGGLARFAKATIDVDLPGGRTKSLEVSGFSAGGGLRLAF
jgi:hypothetical protein